MRNNNKIMTTPKTPTVPEGCLLNSKGHFVPMDQIPERDQLCDQLVVGRCEKAKVLSTAVGKFRTESLDDIAAFVQLSAEKYKTQIGGKKGNIAVYSFDGRYKMTRKIANCIQFDERLQAAKSIIDECLNEWTAGGNPHARTVVQNAFETDGNGNVAAHKILDLRSIKIDDPKWQRATEAIADAIKIVGTKTYICYYERGDNGQYNQITIDPNKV